jgi:succinate dehydrogenase/fumarate reductase flavoprotein subunit
MRLQMLMSRDVGPLRNRDGLRATLNELRWLAAALGAAPPRPQNGFDTIRLDWFDLRNMLLVAETVVQAALAREESRGAHQREDFPATYTNWSANQIVRLRSGGLALEAVPCAESGESRVAE